VQFFLKLCWSNRMNIIYFNQTNPYLWKYWSLISTMPTCYSQRDACRICSLLQITRMQRATETQEFNPIHPYWFWFMYVSKKQTIRIYLHNTQKWGLCDYKTDGTSKICIHLTIPFNFLRNWCVLLHIVHDRDCKSSWKGNEMFQGTNQARWPMFCFFYIRKIGIVRV